MTSLPSVRIEGNGCAVEGLVLDCDDTSLLHPPSFMNSWPMLYGERLYAAQQLRTKWGGGVRDSHVAALLWALYESLIGKMHPRNEFLRGWPRGVQELRHNSLMAAAHTYLQHDST